MNVKEAIEWFERHVYINCSECTSGYDDSCSGARAARCNAFRLAILALKKCYYGGKENDDC